MKRIALALSLLAPVAAPAFADCFGVPFFIMSDGFFLWLQQPPGYVVMGAEAIQAPGGGFWLIKEVQQGPGAIKIPVFSSFESPLLAIAIPYAGNFLVITMDGHAGGIASSPSPGMIGIWYFEDPCDQGGLVPQITLPLAGPIPPDCPIDAWIFTTPKGISEYAAAQRIADTYGVYD